MLDGASGGAPPPVNVVEVVRGASPVVVALPHAGTWIPDDVAEHMNAEGRKLRDTDWHVDVLYRGLLPDVTTVRARFHRYCIDANRDPSGRSLYPGQRTTDLVPRTDFDMRPIWREGAEPDASTIAARLLAYHRPYHEALEAELRRVKGLHGVAVLFDAHSIRSRCPALFEGALPDLNVGTDGGVTCDPAVEDAVMGACAAALGYSSVLNGRFRGGWTTRHYGRPAYGIHAIQLEIAQSTYLATESEPFEYDAGKAHRLRPHLEAMLRALEEAAYRLTSQSGAPPS
jgi:N-formylglutamate deformylase